MRVAQRVGALIRDPTGHCLLLLGTDNLVCFIPVVVGVDWDELR
jgi:hypothetical protein